MSRIAVKPTLQPELFVYSFPVRVYFENTDAGGVVYHAEYLKFLERARTEWLRHLGFDHQTLARDHRVVVVVTAAAIDFARAARLDDNLAVSVRLESLGKVRCVFEGCDKQLGNLIESSKGELMRQLGKRGLELDILRVK